MYLIINNCIQFQNKLNVFHVIDSSIYSETPTLILIIYILVVSLKTKQQQYRKYLLFVNRLCQHNYCCYFVLDLYLWLSMFCYLIYVACAIAFIELVLLLHLLAIGNDWVIFALNVCMLSLYNGIYIETFIIYL